MNMFPLLALLSLSTVPHDVVITSRVDVVEINHFYNGEGIHQIDQLILYDWCDDAERFQVRKFFVIGGGYGKARHITISGNRVLFQADKLRSIQFTTLRKTFTQYDVDLEERKVLPHQKRKDLP